MSAMEEYSVLAYSLEDGKLLKADVQEAGLLYTLESPAASLNAVLICDDMPGMLGEAEFYRGRDCIFRGRIERQSAEIGSGGVKVKIEARTMGARLLDNEALPKIFESVGIDTVFATYIAWHGFTLECFYKPYVLPVYTVPKGISDWEAFCGWTESSYGITPFVYGNIVKVGRPDYPALLTVSNSGVGASFSRLVSTFSPYSVISEIYLRDANGYYASRVENPEAARYRVFRRRYMVPQNEFFEGTSFNATQRISDSTESALGLSLRLPGLVDVNLGQLVDIRDRLYTAENLRIAEWKYIIGEQGLFTELSLKGNIVNQL